MFGSVIACAKKAGGWVGGREREGGREGGREGAGEGGREGGREVGFVVNISSR